MRRAFAILLISAATAAFAGCVNVTTDRSESIRVPTPDGGREVKSKVVVKSWGWDVLDFTIDVLTLPLKLIGVLF